MTPPPRICETCNCWLPADPDNTGDADYCTLWCIPCDPRHSCPHWRVHDEFLTPEQIYERLGLGITT